MSARCGLDGITIEHLIPILMFFDGLKEYRDKP
ncbi:hypothetical protein SAMN05444397_109251 [Flavobacterium aquidurense]|jgi:hypothetical protein|nr:hypothetical protein SAMN05444397_109251 [Flavobacterium aquidurense]